MRKAEFKVSDEDLIKIYAETKSLRKTAIIAQGITGTSTVSKKLKELGVEITTPKLNISDEELITMYESGMSMQEIARKVSGAKGAMGIRRRLRKAGVDTSYTANVHKYKEKMSRTFHTYKVDEHVFDVIDTEEKAYWLGFLMADGYNNTDRTAISLRLQTGDVEILEKFRNFLKTNAPIYTFSRITMVNHLQKEYKEVSVHSVYLSNKLAEIGCVKGKTYSLEYPNYIPETLTNHFIRGYFDGDGCISITKRHNRKNPQSKTYQFTITGRKEFLEILQDKIVESTSVVKNDLKESISNYAQTIHYCGFNVVLKILNYVYSNATIYLKRKHDKYIEMVTRQSNLQK